MTIRQAIERFLDMPVSVITWPLVAWAAVSVILLVVVLVIGRTPRIGRK